MNKVENIVAEGEIAHHDYEADFRIILSQINVPWVTLYEITSSHVGCSKNTIAKGQGYFCLIWMAIVKTLKYSPPKKLWLIFK